MKLIDIALVCVISALAVHFLTQKIEQDRLKKMSAFLWFSLIFVGLVALAVLIQHIENKDKDK